MYKYLIVGVVGLTVSSNLFGAWMSQESGITGTLYDVYFTDTLHGWIAGGGDSIGGKILLTEDGGKNWGVVYPAINRYIEREGGDTVRTSVSIYTIGFLDSLEGWAGGGDGYPDYYGWQQYAVMVHSTNGGKIWDDKGYRDGYSVYGSKIDERISSVNKICIGIGNSNYGFYMVNGHHFTSADYKEWVSIYSLDGLHQWTNCAAYGSEIGGSYGMAICCVAPSHVWALIIQCVNGPETTKVFLTNTEIESLASICELPSSFNRGDMDFTDTLHGWIVRNSGVIYHTEDGGYSWTGQTSGVGCHLHTVDFLDSLNGWVGGAGGTILRTRNGGNTWVKENTSVSSSINSICFVDTTHGWAVGDNGVILCYNGIGIEEKDFTIIDNVEFNISPNICDKYLTLKYQLPIKTRVLLKIYDISGKVVKTLIDREENAGSYNINFNAGDLTSGIYFAKFIAGDYEKTRKLILVR